MSARPRVAVVGGGIAGLTLAATLDPTRFEVELVEAQPERKDLGSALALWPSAQRAIGRTGAWDALRHKASKAPPAGLYSIHGQRLLPVPSVPGRLVERPHLLAALDAVVPSSVRREQAAVIDAREVDADLVVGCDGVRSVVRAQMMTHHERLPTAYVALRGVQDGVPAGTPFGEYWGRGRLFGIAPLPGGRAYWFTTHRSDAAPEPLDVDAVLGEARSVFAGSAQVVVDSLAAAGPSTLATRLWLAPPTGRYVRGRYVVIGDAAHASLPNLGRGANDALLDAASLGSALNGGADLRWWQARRLPVTQAARLAASGIMRTALSGGLRR